VNPSPRACLAAGIALAGLIGSAPFAQAQTFDPNTAFLNFNSGSGPWTTGYETTAGSSLVLYDVFADNGTIQNYHSSVVFSLGTPTFEKNISGSSQITIPSGGIALHPGPNNEYSVIRFTVPTTNIYTINSQFFAGDGGDTDATVLLNNNTGSPLFFAGTTDTNPTYTQSIPLTAGDILDFLVGSKGSFFSDTTPLNLTITSASATPEPGSTALFCGLGVSGAVFALRRRRSRKA